MSRLSVTRADLARLWEASAKASADPKEAADRRRNAKLVRGISVWVRDHGSRY